jgi:superfamily I DNA/RNA helicase
VASLQDLVAVVRRAAALSPDAAAEFTPRGTAVRDVDRDDGWYRIAVQLGPGDLDRLDEAVLAPKAGPNDRRYAVTASEPDDAAVWVRVQSRAPADGLLLWVPTFNARMVRQALADRLAAMPVESLAYRLAEQRLNVVPPVRADTPGLNAAQQRALEACCAPGLQAVWGPPGTGKTYVIVAAVERLIREGKRVLLVSNTNIAVDNAVEGIINRLRPAAGKIVRIGTPRVRSVALEPKVSLPKLIEARQRTAQRTITALRDQITELERADPRHRLTAAETALAGFDIEAYRAAVQRRHNQQRSIDAARAVAAARDDSRAAHTGLEQARARLLAARLMLALVQEHTARQAVDVALQQVADLRSQGRLARLVAVLDIQRAEQRVKAARTALAVAQADRIAAQQDLHEAEYQLPADAYRRIGHWPVADARDKFDSAVDREQVAADQVTEADARLADLLQQRDAAARAPQPTRADHALLASAEALGLVDLYQQLPQLRQAISDTTARLGQIQAKYDLAVQKAEAARPGLERAVVRDAAVVATTLTMLVLKKSITEQPFDHVIIDEAAAADLPAVAHAVGHATSGAVLLGDYLQNGPILDPKMRQPEHAEIGRVYGTDCFLHFGLTDPVQADRTPGCVVMTEQWRFGASLTRLANLVAYQGILTMTEAKDCDIVLVDTDGLGLVLSGIRRHDGKTAGTWPIGGLLARALAEHHHGRDGTIGIITPYKDQVEAIGDLLAGTACGADVEVGTAHAFQGRECDVVIFDMVEDGKGWIAKGSLRGNPFNLAGLRLFNVATTRARRRLYLIGDGAAVQRTKTGPLNAVRRLVHEGLIEHVRASDVLGLDDDEAPPEGTVRHDLWSAMHPYIRLVGIYDEKMVLDQVRHRIDEATASVWMWSPWIGKHSTALQDSLVNAHERSLQVRVMALSEEEVNATVRASLTDLRLRLPHVVLVHNMHQKIVVVDDRWTFVGSMNLLSHAKLPSARRHEVMIQIDNRRFAHDILAFELADHLRKLQRCDSCGHVMREVAERDSGPKRQWFWYCGNDIDGTPCTVRIPMSDRTGRNRPIPPKPRRT